MLCKKMVLGLVCCALSSFAAREQVNFDADWLFMLGDDAAASQPAFDDSDWRVLEVPHDWAFEADYARTAAQGDRGGYKPGGTGWYRKTFVKDPAWKNQRVFIEFDVVFMNSEVWMNGHHLGKRPYGYISFGYELTEFLKPGKNVVAVRADSSLEPAARWYHGCGIYGHVNLVVKSPVHVMTDGVFVTTPKVSDARAEVAVQTEVKNSSTKELPVSLVTTLVSPAGESVDQVEKTFRLQPGAGFTAEQALNIEKPLRWDTETPQLYRAVTTLKSGRVVLDQVTTRFGVRTVRWETETGFWLNEKNIKLRGVCDHSEAGPVGAASPDEILEWKIRLLKEMGCNAIRTAHNPQVPKFYELCDEMGILVMDEIFDGWKKKAPQDYGTQAFAEWWERDLRAWLKRDRNHPSVVIWSLGNETGGAVAKDLVRVCHEMDSTRLVTSGHSASQVMDVEGVNGASERPRFFKQVPSKPFVATEAPHTWQTRGYYRSKTWWRDGQKPDVFPCPDLTDEEIFTYDWAPPSNSRNRKQVFNSSYDNATVRITARKNWELMRDLPWFSGFFRWTGFDYLGEAGYVHGGWPFRLFMGGALDLAGFKKDLYYFYQSQWTEKPMVHILPHWTHPNMEAGTKIPVWVYSNADEVELFLNGRSLGKDRPGNEALEMQCEWLVPWTPGTLEAVAYRKGAVVARARQTTAGKPAQLAVSVERGIRNPILTVALQDEKGVLNPYAENRIYYHLFGPARILSLESGNPVNTEKNVRTSRTAFFGLGRAFLQTTADEGDLSVVVAAICGEPNLLTSKQVHIDVKSVALRGAAVTAPLKVLYSVDGSVPSIVYEGPFKVTAGTVVRAAVSAGRNQLFTMEEAFGPGQGLYWPDEQAAVAGPMEEMGDQAEDAVVKGAVVKTSGQHFHGRGYLDFGQGQGSVEWYQENDGAPGTYTLYLRYSGQAAHRAGRSMKLVVNGVPQELFLENTGDWGRTWKTKTVQVTLRSGANTIQIATVGSGGMYMDEMMVK